MKRLLIMTLVLSSLSLFAQEQPAYLKDAVITVTLTNGKEYKYSANEYAVIKRNAKAKEVESLAVFEKSPEDKNRELFKQSLDTQAIANAKKKNILSVGAVSSQKGFSTSSSASTINVDTKRKIGGELMYQNNIYKDYYLGGRLDTNGGGSVNFGIGF